MGVQAFELQCSFETTLNSLIASESWIVRIRERDGDWLTVTIEPDVCVAISRAAENRWIVHLLASRPSWIRRQFFGASNTIGDEIVKVIHEAGGRKLASDNSTN